MKDLKDTCRVAVVQCAPVMFDKKAGTEKMVELIREAGKNGAELIVFPELIIPCYPYGMTFGYTVGSRDKVGRLDWKRYYDNSLCIPGPETELLGQAAKEVHAYVSIGVSERGEDSATLYNSNLVFSPEGELLNVHRKLKPTGAERLVYGDANKDYFPITDTPWGPMGNLICWESYMPLARVALYQKGITLYISPNTNDNPEWQDTIKHIAIEGHCFFINADMVFTKEMYQGSPLPAGDRTTERHPLPGRKLRGGPLRPLCNAAGVGQGGDHLRRSGYAAGHCQPHGV